MFIVSGSDLISINISKKKRKKLKFIENKIEKKNLNKWNMNYNSENNYYYLFK